MMKRLKQMSGEFFRLARMRIDILAMLVFRDMIREIISDLVKSRCIIHLFNDASPQFVGMEIYVATII